MQTRIRFFMCSAAVMMLIPAGILRHPVLPSTETESAADMPLAAELSGAYQVLDSADGTVRTVPLRDYLIGAVGAEMPAAYEPEALKAQVVACHTYAERIRRQNAETPDPKLRGADFSDDSSRYQAFFTAEEMQQFYGEAYTDSYEKIAAAVNAVGDQLLCYNEEPIAAAFHAISSGETESAETVWGNALPYLVPVNSEADRSAPDYEERISIPPDTLQKVLCAQQPDCTFSDHPAEWFSEPECTASGTVLQIRCGSKEWSGQILREILGLRSACFSVEYDGAQFLFTTRGFGHNVGMSQYGANAMALDGCSYTEILAHYYPGTMLTPYE